MGTGELNRYKFKTYAAVLATCLCTIPSTARAFLVSGQKADAEPSSSRRVVELLGIYESVPVSDYVSGSGRATPTSLDALSLTPAATLQQKNKHGPDPKDLCQVLGPFRLMARSDIRFEILHDPPNKLVMLFENASWGYLRTIRIDAEHIQDFSKIRPMWNGDSIAHWEADTLVIDTIHFTDKTWLNELGVTNSRQLHLLERIRSVGNGKYLKYQATAIDPKVLAQPSSYTRYFRRSRKEIAEYNCYARKDNSDTKQ